MSVAAKSARSIFLEAVESVPSDHWPQFLDSACAGDADLRGEVARLLAAHDRLSGFMAHPAFMPSASEPTGDLPASGFLGQTIGRYKLLEQIGEGGMGVVYVAQQTEPVRRQVALKIIKPGMDSRQVVARFEAERQALALMDHPNIARILDGGMVEEGAGKGLGLGTRAGEDSESPSPQPPALAPSSGRPYFVMELVRGLPITDYCDEARLTPRQRLELFIDVCQAVQHAHQKGIIHRDLKSSNVLVTLIDGQPVVKVIDFGVAKALNQQLTDRTLHTQFSQMIGTPLYMSPEQAELGTLDIDTRSDVYSLGVLLYELLTGQTPFDAETLKRAGYDEMRRMIREDEPPRPSARISPSARVSTLGAPHISTVSQRRSLDHRRLVKHLRGELDWIVMKCLEKDRERRYESASALADDVRRYLDHLPTQARPAGPLVRALKWRRRNPVVFLAGLATLVIVAAAISAGLWHNHRIAHELAVSENLRWESSQRGEKLRQEQEKLRQEHLNVRQERYVSDMRSAWSARESGNADLLAALLDRYIPAGDEPDVRGFEWHYLRRVSRPTNFTLVGHQGELAGLDVSPDGRFLASGDRAGELCIWSLESRQTVKSVQHGPIEIISLRFSPDGQWLASGGTDKIVRIWSVADWEVVAKLTQHEGSIYGLSWSPDSRQLASASRGDGLACVWDASDWSLVKLLSHAGELANIAWSPSKDKNVLAVLERESGVRLWNAADWTDQGLLPVGNGTLALAFSPEGGYIAAGGYNGKLHLFDVATRELVAVVSDTGQIWSLAFPDERHLIQGGEQSIRVWEIDASHKSLTPLADLRTGEATHRSLAIGFGGPARNVLIHPAPNSRDIAVTDIVALVGHENYPARWPIVVLPKRGVVLAKSRWNQVSVKEISSGKRLATFNFRCLEDVALPVVSPDESLLAIDEAGKFRLRDTTTWKVVRTLEPPSGTVFESARFSPDGQWLAAGFSLGQYGVWNLTTGEWRLLSQGPHPEAGCVEFSPGGLLACGVSAGREVAVWDLARNRQIVAIAVPAQVTAMLFLADGTLAIGDFSGCISFHNPFAGEETWELKAHEIWVQCLALSPDGRTLASTGADFNLRLWHVPTRRELFTLYHHDYRICCLEFEPSGDLTFRSTDGKYPHLRPDGSTAPFGVIYKLWTFPGAAVP